MDDNGKKRRKETWTLLNTAWEKKKEKMNLFRKDREYIDWKKKEKTEHLFELCEL